MNLTDAPTEFDQSSPEWQVRMMAMGHLIPRCLFVAAELDLAKRLAQRAQIADELADAAGVHGPTLYRVLRALASVGVFKENGKRRFANTPLSETLRSDAPNSLRPWILMFGDETSWRSWGELSYSLKTGGPAFEHLYGMNCFEYMATDPVRSKTFDEAMSTVTWLTSDAMVQAYDFTNTKLLIDVGGGNGTLLCAILNANPKLRGIVFDLPHVQTSAINYIASQGLQVRSEFIAGSFFDSELPEADTYIVQRVLHDWDDAHCVRVLRACANAACQRARMLIAEAIIRPGNEAFVGKLMDLHMLVMTHGGRERTLEEYQALLSEAGWAYTRVVSTTSPYSMIEGVKR